MRVVSRAEWGAYPARSRVLVPWSQRVGVTVHHSAGPANQSVAAIQRYHMDVNKWSDVGYNLLVDQQGRVYEGRGWDVLGAHATGHNAGWIGVCWLGNSTQVTPSVAARRAMRWCVEEAQRRAGGPLEVRGHGQMSGHATECPGTHWLKWINEEMVEKREVVMPSVEEIATATVHKLINARIPRAKEGDVGVGNAWVWALQHAGDNKQSHRQHERALEELLVLVKGLVASVAGQDVEAVVRAELDRYRELERADRAAEQEALLVEVRDLVDRVGRGELAADEVVDEIGRRLAGV